MPMIDSTKLLQKKIKLMFDYEAEFEFYRIKGLFNNEIDVPAIVATFREVYDDDFNFEGTPQELYLFICDWIEKNFS